MDSLRQKVLYGRAFEAAVWGMPAVNYRLMYDAAVAAGMADNQLVWWPGRMTWRNQSLTPNPDVIYLMPFYDTRNGPVVLEIPPAVGGKINGSVMNYWQAAIEDVGPAGVDAGTGGKYLILPPAFADEVPDGYLPLRSDTSTGYALLRSIPADGSDESLQQAIDYATKIGFYPYRADGTPGMTTKIDVLSAVYDAKIGYDASLFDVLDSVVQVEPWLDRDRVMIDQLVTLGITRGQDFKPDPDTQQVLATAAEDARAWFAERYRHLFDSTYYPDAHWTVPASEAFVTSTEEGFTDTESYPVDDRGLTFTFAFFSTRHLGKGQAYLMAIADADGSPLDGAATYRLTVPADVPVSQYWSATVYDSTTHTFIEGADRLSCSSHTPGLVTGEDGTVEVYFGATAPPGLDGNRVPTGENFEVLFRLYGPQDAYFDKTWTLPDLQRLP